MPALFSRLTARGFVLGVATTDSESHARETFRALGVSAYLSFVCGYDSGFGAKPEPGMVEAFCRHLALQPEEVLLVGDSTHDLRMGRAAGVGGTVGVLSGTSPRATLEGLADWIAASVDDLETILECQANRAEEVH